MLGSLSPPSIQALESTHTQGRTSREGVHVSWSRIESKQCPDGLVSVLMYSLYVYPDPLLTNVSFDDFVVVVELPDVRRRLVVIDVEVQCFSQEVLLFGQESQSLESQKA